ncbi:MAG: PH domain-containing protein [Flavobacteriales bacterium]
MSEYNFHEFNRQNVLGVVILFIQSVRRTLNAFLAFFAYSLFSGGMKEWLWAFFGLSLIVSGVIATLRYKNFQFKLTDKQLILNSGILTKEVTNIPLERIQSVHLHQNFIQRILGITGLKIDTAGSVAQELEISALKRNKAKSLLKALQPARRARSVLDHSDSNELSYAIYDVVEAAPAEQHKLVDLDFKALILLAITENHVRNGLLAIAVIFGYLGQYLDYSEEYLIELFDDYAPELIENTVIQITAFVILFLVLSVLLSFVQVILKFWDFKASVSEESFQIESGLLKRNEFSIPLNKIQFLEWQTNLIRQIPGFESIKIHQGKSTDQLNKSQMEIPACYAEQTNEVMGTLFPEIDEDDYFVLSEPHKFQIRFRSIIMSLIGIPAAFIFGLASEWYISAVVIYLAYMAFTIYSAYRYYESVNLWLNNEVLIYERGWLFPKRTVLKLFKLQTVEIRQSIFQKKRGICHLLFSTAAGGRSFRFFNHEEMRQVRDFMLYKIESSQRKWM